MNSADFSRRLAKGAYRATRIMVRIMAVLAVLAVAMFIFLRIHGVPAPLLQEILRRINAAGVPVEVKGITLTLHGWRADQVGYYSGNPDDLEPLFAAEHVFFSIRNSKQRRAGSDILSLDVRAVEVELNPSVDWGVEVPRESPLRQVEQIEVSLGFLDDRILVSDGTVAWLGSVFNVNGTILKRMGRIVPERAGGLLSFLSGPVKEAQIQAIEDKLNALSIPNGAVVDLDFTLDAGDYAASRVNLSLIAEDVGYNEGGFSKVELEGSYAYPLIAVERIALFDGRQSFQVSGEYNLDSGQSWGSLFNSITSSRILQVLPESAQVMISGAGLQIEQLPRVTLDFGPAAPKDLLNRLSGEFSIRGLGFRGAQIEALRGQVKRENGRLEFTQLHGSIMGQEAEVEAGGSAMQGGEAEGSVFWDGNTREFGVEADASFDPNLLVQALSFSKIATNIIRRISFRDLPPQGHLALGSCVDDWSTFYINIRARANDVAVQDVEFSSLNVVQTYQHGILSFDPATGMQGSDFIKGSARIDLNRSTATFDALSSINPAALEDLIYPDLNLFGNHITFEGEMRVSARGVFDWKSMEQTDFTATVEAEQAGIPIAALNRFTADVVGSRTNITVQNAAFGLYGGKGEGRFSLNWNPPEKALPYSAGFSFSDVDFKECLVYVLGNEPVTIGGTMAGDARIAADFSTNFLAAAGGNGFLRVDNGQLADLPLFQGFSRLMRKVFPSFKVFSITSLRGHFTIADGVISSEDAYFGGDFLSAKGRGNYSYPSGFDAYIQAQVFSEGRISKMVRVLTDPLMKLLEMKLEGTLSDPSWKLEKF